MVFGTVNVVPRLYAVEVATRCATALADDAFVFSNPRTGGPMRPDVMSARYHRLAKRIGVPGRLHDLRHWHATQLLAGGTNVRQVAGRLGHANPMMTLNVYSHFLEAGDREAAEQIGRGLSSAPAG